jgi:hypothetical protein
VFLSTFCENFRPEINGIKEINIFQQQMKMNSVGRYRIALLVVFPLLAALMWNRLGSTRI